MTEKTLTLQEIADKVNALLLTGKGKLKGVSEFASLGEGGNVFSGIRDIIVERAEEGDPDNEKKTWKKGEEVVVFPTHATC